MTEGGTDVQIDGWIGDVMDRYWKDGCSDNYRDYNERYGVIRGGVRSEQRGKAKTATCLRDTVSA